MDRRNKRVQGDVARFLAVLAESGNVTAAAREAGLTRTKVYALRSADPVFAAAWADAEAQAVDLLEAEARRRAVDGIEQPIIRGGSFVRHEDGSIAVIRQYSDRLLEFLLKARRPDTFGTSHLAPVEPLSDAERARRIALLVDAGRARRTRPDPADDS